MNDKRVTIFDDNKDNGCISIRGMGPYMPVDDFITLELENDNLQRKLQGCLEVLTEMRYFGENHKMSALAWNAINAVSPELAELEPDKAFHKVHGLNEDEQNEWAIEL